MAQQKIIQLLRKSTVSSGNEGDWTASAGTNSDDCEWIVYDQNEWSYVGSHTLTFQQVMKLV